DVMRWETRNVQGNLNPAKFPTGGHDSRHQGRRQRGRKVRSLYHRQNGHRGADQPRRRTAASTATTGTVQRRNNEWRSMTQSDIDHESALGEALDPKARAAKALLLLKEEYSSPLRRWFEKAPLPADCWDRLAKFGGVRTELPTKSRKRREPERMT